MALLLTLPFVTLVSLLFDGIDRKIHARMQNRIGPPVIQPFYDFIKLFNKERVVPLTAASGIFTASPIIAVSAAILAAAIPVANVLTGTSMVGDLLLIMYLLAMFSIMVIIGGSSSGNPYGAIGFARKMMMLITYEIPLLIAIASLAFNPHLSLAHYDVVQTQARTESLLVFTYPSMAVAAAAFLLCMPAAATVVPFDIPEAKTEIAHGLLVEYGGPYLALMKLAKATSNFALAFLAATLFFYVPALVEGRVPLGAPGSLAVCLVITLIIMLLTLTVPRTVLARLKVGQAFKFYWLGPLILSVASLGLSIVGL